MELETYWPVVELSRLLGVAREPVVKVPEALAWTAVWVALALAFNVLVYFLYSERARLRLAQRRRGAVVWKPSLRTMLDRALTSHSYAERLAVFMLLTKIAVSSSHSLASSLRLSNPPIRRRISTQT